MDEQRTARLVAIAALAFLLFNAPLLSLFVGGARVLGVPLLWAYLVGAWVLVIVLVQRTTRHRDRS
jgi:UDP-N-acetylmuramyl pentapeptide phosphotransferase/UDP-N-acetylglucosamine-1-phosphate transferase